MADTRELAVPRGDVTLHGTLLGSGPPILLLAGGPGGSCDDLRPVAAELARTRCTVLLEQRGTGRSRLPRLDRDAVRIAEYVADFEAVRRHLGYDTWDVLGHSAGGTLALALAAAHPATVARLIAVDSAGVDLSFVEVAQRNQRHTADELAAMAHWSQPAVAAADPARAAREVYAAWVAGVVHDRASVDAVLAHFTSEPDTQAIAGLFLSNLMDDGFDLRPQLRAFAGRALVVQGRQGLMGAEVGAAIVRALRHGELVVLDDCGHYPMDEQPEAFWREVRRFLGTR